jgi:hypothetical protein
LRASLGERKKTEKKRKLAVKRDQLSEKKKIEKGLARPVK